MKHYLFFGLRRVALAAFVSCVVPSVEAGSPEKVDWSTFAEYEPWKTAKIPAALAKVNKKVVKVPGFMQPLEVDSKNTTQFIFVPSLPACSHVPAPPPNMTVLVKMKAGTKALVSFDPVWVTGSLTVLENKNPQMGDALYEIQGTSVEPYK